MSRTIESTSTRDVLIQAEPRTNGQRERRVCRKLAINVAVITGASTGMRLATAKRFVQEDAEEHDLLDTLVPGSQPVWVRSSMHFLFRTAIAAGPELAQFNASYSNPSSLDDYSIRLVHAVTAKMHPPFSPRRECRRRCCCL